MRVTRSLSSGLNRYLGKDSGTATDKFHSQPAPTAIGSLAGAGCEEAVAYRFLSGPERHLGHGPGPASKETPFAVHPHRHGELVWGGNPTRGRVSLDFRSR